MASLSYSFVYSIFLPISSVYSFTTIHSSDISWTGGSLHLECELTAGLLKKTGQYVKNNTIAVKAVSHNDKIYVLTPRLKHGVVATVAEVVHGRQAPELQPFPDLKAHTLADCDSLQNAVDFYLDIFGTLWILDSGIVDTLVAPRCTCRPKVVAMSLLLRKITRLIDLSPVVEPTSLLQNIVVDYALGTKPFVYVSDASRGAVIVHDVGSDAGWTTLVCAPAAGLQLSIFRRTPAHATLLIARIPHSGLLELDTASLQRKYAHTPLRVFGEHIPAMLLLGADPFTHHVFLRYKDRTEVLAWNIHEAFNSTKLLSIHTPCPRLIPTSANSDPLRPNLIILDTSYAESIQRNIPTSHKITILSKL